MSASPVLLWGSPRDVPIAAVCTALSRLGTPMFLIDQARVQETALGFDSRANAGWLRMGDRELDLAAVRSVYIRPDAGDRSDSASCRHAFAVEDAFSAWLELTSTQVVNRPSAMASNGSKPFQAALIRAAGLAVPDTLLTNDLDALREFQALHGAIVYKSTSGVRSIVSRLSLDDGDRLARLSTCPTQFQQHIPGPDFRVHVIGDEIHGHEIRSEAVDYRYPGSSGARVSSWTVPSALADSLFALSRSLGLAMSGIDLRRAADGRWVCFEVNPSPGFTYFDIDDEQTLAQATARLLSTTGVLQ